MVDREGVRERIHRQFVKETEDSEDSEANERGSENEEDWLDPWEPLVHNFFLVIMGYREKIDGFIVIPDSLVGYGA